jgi:hypothetical protein
LLKEDEILFSWFQTVATLRRSQKKKAQRKMRSRRAGASFQAKLLHVADPRSNKKARLVSQPRMILGSSL